MLFYIIAAILTGVFLYQVLAYILHIAPLKQAFLVMRGLAGGSQEKQNNIALLSNLSKPLARYMPISLAKEIKYSRILQNISVETPKEFFARLLVTFILIAIFAIPLALVNPWLALIPLVGALITVFITQEETKDKAKKMHQAAESEIPSFVETLSHSIKTDRNVLHIIDTYISNYKGTPLSLELTRTVADMRTGSADVALKRFEIRMNNPLLSQLIRGILATMRGEDMTSFFRDLVKKVHETRKKTLVQKALKVVPKVSLMSNLRAFWAIGVLLIIVGMGIAEYIKGAL